MRSEARKSMDRRHNVSGPVLGKAKLAATNARLSERDSVSSVSRTGQKDYWEMSLFATILSEFFRSGS